MTARQTTRAGEVLNGVKAQVGEKFQSFKHTHVGAGDVVTFGANGLPDMLDADYRVLLSGESTMSAGDAISVDESSINTAGFTFIGGTAAEITHVFVHGNVEE